MSSAPTTASPTSTVAPTTAAPMTAAPTRAPLPGFDETAIRITDAAGALVEGCVLLADDAASRQQGLMDVTDPSLGGYDGMLFTFAVPTSSSFYMLRTRLALSIAFFDGAAFGSALDMAPCPSDDDEPRCPRYLPEAPYTQALEVPAGQLPALGIGPGARLESGGACPPLRTG